jgi:hypothetical protein
MTQDECLNLQSHFTHLGVCYPGSVAWVQISNPQDPKPATFHTNASVPEPSTFALFALAMLVAWVFHVRPRCRYR